jgi:hypothetical protein
MTRPPIQPPTRALAAELCFTAPPEVDPIDVMQAVLEARPGAQLVRPEGPSGPFVVVVPEPAAVSVAVSPPAVVDVTTEPVRDLTQTWGWSGGREAAAVTLAHTTHTVTLTETSDRTQGAAERVRAFHDVFSAVVTAAPPAATWWPGSEQALEPGTALARRLGGLVNVRMFNDAERSGYVVMDTLGMASFGLLDVQCRFRDLEYDRVAGLLYDVASYLVDGATITDGHALDGVEPGRKWRAYTVGSMVGPDRPVLALRP